MEHSVLISPPSKNDHDTDTLKVSVFRLFEVAGSGRGIDQVPKLVPLVLFGAGIITLLSVVIAALVGAAF
ncbi:hypothetical protein [Caulobacter sp. 17J80-11]|uniref:hypothetical protein n=1 Tax=Caulobacter sp. 17J80-11 TaxID=2763502 RepID=UPI001653ED10|nr:hypothetical protein [Caulobacter sp. 17J80-11]MBC6980933.1 hypothetical protein [Caulobacter sp. 17J80-11]